LNIRALLIDPETINAEKTRLLLSQELPDLEVDLVSSLREARHQAQSTPPFDIVLIDADLLDGNGIDFISERRAKAPSTGIIVIANHSDQNIAVTLMRAGADDFIIRREKYLERLPYVILRTIARVKTEKDRKVRSLRVFYADDNEDDLSLTARHLIRHAPYLRLDTFLNFQRLIENFSRPENGNPCDVLLLDYQLPGYNAFEILKMIKYELGFDIPVVIVSGQGDAEIAAQAFRYGAANYLVKNDSYLFGLPGIIENAFERSALEQERRTLRKSEALLHNAQRRARMGSWEWDAVKNSAVCSEEFRSIFGISENQVKNNARKVFLRQILREDRNLTLRAIEKAWKAGGLFDVEFRFNQSNQEAFVQTWGEVITDTSGKIIKIVGSSQDITERKKAEEERLVLAAAVEQSADLIIITDLTGKIEYVNQSVIKLSGFGREEIIGRTPEIFKSGLHPTEFYSELWKEILKGNAYRNIIINRKKNGEYWHSEKTITPIVGSDGKIKRFVSTDKDITARVQSEEIIRRSAEELKLLNERLQIILNDMQDGVVVVDENGDIEYTNESFDRIFGYVEGDLSGRNVDILIPASHKTKIGSYFTGHLDDPDINILRRTLEAPALHKKGHEIVIQIGVTALKTTQGKRYTAVIHDLTEFIRYRDTLERQVEKQIIDLNKVLEREKALRRRLAEALLTEQNASQMKQNFVSMASHEFRTPLAIMRTSTDILLHYFDRLSDEERRLKIEKVQSEIQKMNNMLEGLTFMERIESRAKSIQTTTVKLPDFINRIISDNILALGMEAGIDLSLRLDRDLLPVFEMPLFFILTNLISNAIKYSDRDSPPELKINHKEQILSIRIGNSGNPFPEDKKNHLFEPFYRGHKNSQISGSGLGLAIVKRAVDVYRGSITLETDGSFTVFEVLLPDPDTGSSVPVRNSSREFPDGQLWENEIE